MSGQLRARIDLNVRIGKTLTYCGYDDVTGEMPPSPRGLPIEVYEEESCVKGPGEIVVLDRQRHLVYIKVDWSKLCGEEG
jgi:hypothetical protein